MPSRVPPTAAGVAVAGCVATITRLRSPVALTCRVGKSKSARCVPGASVSGLVIGRSLETRLNGWQVEQMVILAAHDVGQPRAIEDNGSIAIVSIQPDHRLVQ